jgi:hypothetical protein
MESTVKKEALELILTFKTGELDFTYIKKIGYKTFKFSKGQLESRLRWLIENGYLVRIDYGRYMRILNKIDDQTQIQKTEIPVKVVHIKKEVGLIRKFWRWIY